MGAAKYTIRGSDYVGAFATATDKHVLLGATLKEQTKRLISDTLGIEPIALSVFGTEMVGLFMRANSTGIVVSNMIEDHELEALKRMRLGLNITALGSGLNAIGNNILANDKIALVNTDYDHDAVKQIADTLGVEVILAEIGGYKTLGANNILTNKGFVINNRATDEEKERFDKITGFESVRTTANTGSLNIGLSTITNSNGLVVGDETTGYELTRIMDGLNLK